MRTLTFEDLSRDPYTEPSMKAYIEAGHIRTKDEFFTLHMFFSPERVSGGLTPDEISKCISLSALRKMQKDKFVEKYGRRIALRRQFIQSYVELSSERALRLGLVPEMEVYEAEAQLGWARLKFPDELWLPSVFPPPSLPRKLISENIDRVSFEKGIREFVEEASLMIHMPRGKDLVRRNS